MKKALSVIFVEKTSQLDFHHYHTLSPLLQTMVKKQNKLLPENILSFRDEFIEEHWAELYEHTVTLCHAHHLQLHKVYGRNPGLGTAKKQETLGRDSKRKTWHGMIHLLDVSQ